MCGQRTDRLHRSHAAGPQQIGRYRKKTRASLRKLRDAGFVAHHDIEKRYLAEFVDVYQETMRRAGAHPSYFFDRCNSTYSTRELDTVTQLFVVLKDREVAAATLSTVCNGIVEDHLGGTRDAFLKWSPDRLVVDTERAWGTSIGARTFHLGGGVGAQQDSRVRLQVRIFGPAAHVLHVAVGLTARRVRFAGRRRRSVEHRTTPPRSVERLLSRVSDAHCARPPGLIPAGRYRHDRQQGSLPAHPSMYRVYGKRLLDLAGAILATGIAAIPMMAIAVLIRKRMGSPVLYRAVRPGLNGTPFVVYKFRTMRTVLKTGDRLLSDAERVTPLGRALRRSSLDELPQLLNVIRGQMSLVGPRPLKPDYLPLYTPAQARRHDVRPGITGLAQITGRNTLDWDERLRLDTAYADDVGFLLDIKILVRTVAQVLRRQSVSLDGDLDVPSFSGSARQDSPHAPSPPAPPAR